jgi:uncharacterized membrane protein YgcG
MEPVSYCVYPSTLRTEGIHFSETSVGFHRTTQRFVPEHQILFISAVNNFCDYCSCNYFFYYQLKSFRSIIIIIIIMIIIIIIIMSSSSSSSSSGGGSGSSSSGGGGGGGGAGGGGGGPTSIGISELCPST